MERGDIEIRVRGPRLGDLDAEQLGQFIATAARLFGNTTLIRVHPTYFVLRPRPSKEETPP